MTLNKSMALNCYLSGYLISYLNGFANGHLSGHLSGNLSSYSNRYLNGYSSSYLNGYIPQQLPQRLSFASLIAGNFHLRILSNPNPFLREGVLSDLIHHLRRKVWNEGERHRH